MEHLLWLYAQPHDPKHPVVCFDERPCYLIGEALDPLPLMQGQPVKEHYAYIKNGSCALLAAIEPLTGRRLAQVHAQRTRLEYTQFCQAIAARWPEAETITLVQDNLNTHSAGAFYAHLPAHEARALAERFDFVYTPKSASWLNMIEIEFSAIVRQCLNRRIPTIEQLTDEVLALVQEREAKGIQINWQFSITTARTTMNRHYSNVLPANQEYLIT
jgi:hypothetical protein